MYFGSYLRKWQKKLSMRNLILITTLLGLYTHGVTAQVIDYVDDKYYKLEDGEVKPYKTIKDPYSSDLASLMVTSAPEFEGDIQTSADGKQGKKDADGKIVIPFIYDALYMATEGLYNARIKRKWGLVNIMSCRWQKRMDNGVGLICPARQLSR